MKHAKVPQHQPTAGEHRESKLSVVYRPIAELMLNPRNPRLHSKKQIRQIANSVKSFGFNVPVLIDGQSQIVAGHGRVLACQELGIREVPTIRLHHLTEMQARAFLLADNKLTINSEWDERLLGEQLKVLADANLDFNLEATGFEVGEIDLSIEGLTPVSEGKADAADQLPEPGPRVSQVGDVWLLGRHRIVCGNALEESTYHALMGTHKAAMAFIDPPFNVRIAGHVSGLGRIRHREFAMASGEMTESAFTDFLTRAIKLLVRSMVAGSLLYVAMDWRHIAELLAASRSASTEYKNLCVWNKGSGGMGSLYRSQHELIFVFKHGKAPHRNNVQLGQYGRNRTNVWTYPGANSFARSSEEGNLLALHPTVKPVALVADAMLDASARGDVVLDAFLGSGTTLIAAERTGRIACGIELDPAYVDTVIRRWRKWTGQQARHAQTGRLFTDRKGKKGAV